MKKTLLLLIIVVASVLTAFAQTKADLSQAAIDGLDEAFMLTNSGEAEAAMEILNKLDKENPNNYSVLRGMAFTYSMSGEYNKALEICKRMENHPAASYHAYQLEGNTLKSMGKEEDAIKAYNRGLERFPNSPLLYIEQGKIADGKQDYDKARDMYEKAIEADPSEPWSYWFLAVLYADSNEPFWTVMYAEAARLLTMNKEEYKRDTEEMSLLLNDVYHDNIGIAINTQEDSILIVTSFTDLDEIAFSPDTMQMYVLLPVAFNKEMATALIPEAIALKSEKEITLQSIINARGRFIDSFFEQFIDYYDVPIFDYQRLVRQSGHWQAYNMMLFGLGDPDGLNHWYETDPTAREQMEAFTRWYEEHPFTSTAERPTLASKVYRQINLGVPSNEEVSNAEGCREHSADALRLARWWHEQPHNPKSYMLMVVRNFLFIWCVNSDEVTIELRGCSVEDSEEGMLAMMFAMAEYGLEHKVKALGEEGFAYAFKKALTYLDKNRAVIEIPERVEECLKMTPEQLNQRIHEEFQQAP